MMTRAAQEAYEIARDQSIKDIILQEYNFTSFDAIELAVLILCMTALVIYAINGGLKNEEENNKGVNP
jgi:hypothetical protein